MKGGPTPAPGSPPSPARWGLFRVSYRTARGETFSKLFRQEAAARRFASRVLDHGGSPRLHATEVERWRELDACNGCALGIFGHGHYVEQEADWGEYRRQNRPAG